MMRIILVFCAFLGLTVGLPTGQLKPANPTVVNNGCHCKHYHRMMSTWKPEIEQWIKTWDESRPVRDQSYFGQLEWANLASEINKKLSDYVRNGGWHHYPQTNASWSTWKPEIEQWIKTWEESRPVHQPSFGQSEWANLANEINTKLFDYVRDWSSEGWNHHYETNLSWSTWKPELEQWIKTWDESRPVDQSSFGQLEWDNLANEINKKLSDYVRDGGWHHHHHDQKNVSWSTWEPEVEQWIKTWVESRPVTNQSSFGQLEWANLANEINTKLIDYVRNGGWHRHQPKNVSRSTWKPEIEQWIKTWHESRPVENRSSFGQLEWTNLANEIKRKLSDYGRNWKSENWNHLSRKNVSWNTWKPEIEQWIQQWDESRSMENRSSFGQSEWASLANKIHRKLSDYYRKWSSENLNHHHQTAVFWSIWIPDMGLWFITWDESKPVVPSSSGQSELGNMRNEIN